MGCRWRSSRYLDKIVESDRDATMSDVDALQENIQNNYYDKTGTEEYVQQYIRDNFATLMAQYLNSAEATANKPTTAEISAVFNEEEEA